MCEGIARAGNGLCLMSTTAESIIGKCSKLVRASRTYILKNISVDWGVHPNVADSGVTEPNVPLQAPAAMTAMYPGSRSVVFALFEDEMIEPPKEVVIRAQRDGHGEVLQLSVPVQTIDFAPTNRVRPLIQTLAARKAIMDLEDRARAETTAETTKPLIVRLSVRYQVMSKHTSFIAVDKQTQVTVGEGLVSEHGDTPEQYPSMKLKRKRGRPPKPSTSPATNSPGNKSSFVGTLAGTSNSPTSWSAPQGDGPRKRRPGCRRAGAALLPDSSSSTPPEDIGEEDKPLLLIRLQSYDGSFPLTDHLVSLLSSSSSSSSTSLTTLPTLPTPLPSKVWATALAVSWLKTHLAPLADRRELLDSLVEKAIEYIRFEVPDVDIDVLFARAEEALVNV